MELRSQTEQQPGLFRQGAGGGGEFLGPHLCLPSSCTKTNTPMTPISGSSPHKCHWHGELGSKGESSQGLGGLGPSAEGPSLPFTISRLRTP